MFLHELRARLDKGDRQAGVGSYPASASAVALRLSVTRYEEERIYGAVKVLCLSRRESQRNPDPDNSLSMNDITAVTEMIAHDVKYKTKTLP